MFKDGDIVEISGKDREIIENNNSLLP